MKKSDRTLLSWSAGARASLLADSSRLIHSPLRRRLLGGALSLGGLSLLTGCVLSDEDSIDPFLKGVSRLNDRAQALLFDPDRLAPVYRPDQITRPFPFNAYYGVDQIRHVDDSRWRLQLSGQIRDRRAWSLQELAALPQQEQITRHICVEGWSAIGRWGGVRFADFLRRIGADLNAPYVGFKCFDDYYTSIDMPTALHPQTLLALSYDGKLLPPEYGHPLKLRMPTKLGYKNPKYIAEIFVTSSYPGGYWEDQGYNWFGGS
jgi:DMSO/TMAO reductase YedYZ molybdopterin-dependent catalytic subunit